MDAVCRASGWNTRKREKGRKETGVGGVGVALSAEVQYSPGPISGVKVVSITKKKMGELVQLHCYQINGYWDHLILTKRPIKMDEYQ